MRRWQLIRQKDQEHLEAIETTQVPVMESSAKNRDTDKLVYKIEKNQIQN